MGSIQHTFDPDTNLTVFTAKDHITLIEIQAQILTFLRGETTDLVIWDFREGSIEILTTDEIRMVLSNAMPFTEKRIGGRTAIICAKDIDFGLSRMFQILAELYYVPFEISVFRETEEAQTWLNSSREPLDSQDTEQ